MTSYQKTLGYSVGLLPKDSRLKFDPKRPTHQLNNEIFRQGYCTKIYYWLSLIKKPLYFSANS